MDSVHADRRAYAAPLAGDYLTTSFSGGMAFPVIGAANAPSGSVFDGASYTVQGGVSISGSAKAAVNQVNPGSNNTVTPSSVASQ